MKWIKKGNLLIWMLFSFEFFQIDGGLNFEQGFKINLGSFKKL